MSIIAAPTSQGELLPTPEDEPVASGRINYVKLLKLFTNKHISIITGVIAILRF